MEGEIESEPLALKNIPAMVNGHLVIVSVLYSRKNSRKKSTKFWEENGDCSPLHATTKGLLVRFSLRFQKVDLDKYCEISAVSLKSTKKWNFSKRKEKLGRYAKHSSYYKSSSTQWTAAPTTQLDPPPPPPSADLATRYFKRKISKDDLVTDMTSSLKKRTQSKTNLRQEIAAKYEVSNYYTKQAATDNELRLKYLREREK